MTETYYAAVEDDPLTSGKGSRVFSDKQCGTIMGEDGKRRRLAFIGDTAYCAKCDSTGLITYGSGLGDGHRLIDRVNGGRRQAVGGDIVLCKCADPPRIIAIYGRRWIIHDRDDKRTTSKHATLAPFVNHWISFALREQGNCEGMRCVAHFADGSKEYGTFNASNTVRFERANNGSPCARVEVVLDDSAEASGSVTESILASIAG
ncbi:hypothetical protein BJG93_24715 [Paraburkholderia sprentiae WSM5005]|uniref:PAAR domain-containing protein n=1 Tax=Paraburkholderia sprentiae WSM5005 TaxID=754502 RepID=A0A1I9YQS5_9BURK|nr:hypothetical protein [Paraburkholderia sprentiae]APA88549.1 hypothetical protein BJG93_24715 [Paraburkholderia sprentiae WSM5005]